MAAAKSVGVGTGIVIALAALGVLLAVAVGRVTSSSADTLSLDTVVFSGDNLGLWARPGWDSASHLHPVRGRGSPAAPRLRR